MKIEAIEVLDREIPLKPEYHMVSALGQCTGNRFVVVRLFVDAGIEGLGEATVTARWSGETVASVTDVITNLLFPSIKGVDVNDIAEINRRMDFVCKHNWFAKSAVEMACWDIIGKDAGKPVYELLGGAVRPLSFRSRFSMGAYDVPRAQKRAQELVDMGFTTIKVKVGGEAEADIARVRAVREVIGFNHDLVIDANCGWSVETAIHCVKAMESARVDLVEQPTPDGDYEGMARLRRETGAKVLADDICFNLIHAKELIRNESCDAISVYPGKNGGIQKTIDIIQYAAEHGIPCTMGSNIEWDIGTAAMGHVIVSQENMAIEQIPGDVLGPSYHEQRVVSAPIDITGPITTLNDTPGLGVGELTI